jgi:PII-like signaling protein
VSAGPADRERPARAGAGPADGGWPARAGAGQPDGGWPARAGAAAAPADCLKLTSYFGERRRAGGTFVADALLDLYGQHEIAASILLRGMTGFGLTHHLRTDRSLTLSEDLPLMAIAVDSRPRIEAVLGRTLELNSPGLITLERARLLTGDAGRLAFPDDRGVPDGPGAPGVPDGRHEATKLTVYLGRQERVYRVPAFAAVCDLLHRRGIAGATALLGVDGTAHGRRERARFFSRNAEVPMMVVAVGSGERIGQVLPELGALLRRPLLTLERVRVCKRDGQLLARPGGLPGVDSRGMALWQKLTVYTSESAQHHGQPVHRAIVGRLRAAGLSGATTLRGIWGFHGDHPPHGDRLLQLGRHAPAVTIVIDTPERISLAFAVIDELTAEHGLVTSETIPAMRAAGGGRRRGGLKLATHHLR